MRRSCVPPSDAQTTSSTTCPLTTSRTGISCSPTAAVRSATARPRPSLFAGSTSLRGGCPTASASSATKTAAQEILASLRANYSTADHPESNALLLHGIYDKPRSVGVDEGTLWGDYFYLEALTRYIK